MLRVLGYCKYPNLLHGHSQAAVPVGWEDGRSAWLGTQANSSAAEPALAELSETLGCSILASLGTEAERWCLRSAKEESLGVSVVR